MGEKDTKKDMKRKAGKKLCVVGDENSVSQG